MPGHESEFLEGVHSVVIVGANGSGKSRLGAWIEQNAIAQLGMPVHRISAQRVISFPADVQPKPFERAQRWFQYGHEGVERWHYGQILGSRWNGRPVSHALSDFDQLVAILFADRTRRDRDYTQRAEECQAYESVPPCMLATLVRMWRAVLSHRELVLGDHIVQVRASGSGLYPALELSDGERVAFYLIGQALAAPPGAVLVIDEPENHLHRAIQPRLWDQIEAERPDCLFVYLTHNLEFAASRVTAKKVWAKAFDGTRWDWEEITPNEAVPDELLFEVLGSRKPVLFVEGRGGSLDRGIFDILYPDRLVVPREGCERVVTATMAFRD
jgi:hypothetical protein